jgi:hypothetical protein
VVAWYHEYLAHPGESRTEATIRHALRAKYSYFIISRSWVKDRCNGDVVVGLLIIVRLIDNLL